MNKSMRVGIGLSVLFLMSMIFNLIQYSGTHSDQAATTTSLLQADTLCDLAKEHLKEHWTGQRKNVEKIFQVVNSPTEMDEKLKSALLDIFTTLNLEESQLTDLKPKYKEIFSNHVSEFRKHFNRKPEPNWPAMFHTLKNFYSAEDELMQASFGSDAREKFRKSQLQKRTPMLALIGQYAEIPWDEHIQW